jgi:hypothetical protein
MDELLFHFNFLKKREEENISRGRSAIRQSDFYVRRAQLTESEDHLLRNILTDTSASLKIIDEEIKDITQQFRASVANGLAPGQPVPPIPSQLLTLKKERETLLSKLPHELKDTLGETAYQKLDTFIYQDLAPRIRPIMGESTIPATGSTPSQP